MIKIKKLTGFMIFLLFGIIFISCGKPSKKDIIDKGYILEVGVSNEIDREFAGKMEHSPTYTIFKVNIRTMILWCRISKMEQLKQSFRLCCR